MRKIGLLLGALLVSLNCYASSSDANSLNSSINNSLKSGKQLSAQANKYSIVYGGQDVSGSVIATANEQLWKGGASAIG